MPTEKTKWKIEDVDRTFTDDKTPRMVQRAGMVLEGLGNVLITTKRLAQKLGVSYSAVLMHTTHPNLDQYRVLDGNRVWWSNAKIIKQKQAEMAAEEAKQR